MNVLSLIIVLLALCSVGISALKNITITTETDLRHEFNQFASKSDAKLLFLDNVIVESIAEDSFKDYPNLQIIQIEKTGITEIPENLFRFNTEIRILAITHNLLTSLSPNTFAAQKKMVSLELAQNRLQSIDENLFRNNEKLIGLRLRFNQIATIQPRTFEKLVNLKTLMLSYNRLSTLPENVFANNRKLVYLSLSNNIFKVLSSPALFANNRNLRVLDLSGNFLQRFDFNLLSENDALKYLILQMNVLLELLNLEQAKQFLPKLNDINLSKNNFNCSYYSKVYTLLQSDKTTVLPVLEPTTFEGLDAMEKSKICILDEGYGEELARRLRDGDKKINVPQPSIAEVKQSLYEMEPVKVNWKLIARNFENVLEDLENCENGIEGYVLKVLEVCESSIL